jgi:hypothetical protein
MASLEHVCDWTVRHLRLGRFFVSHEHPVLALMIEEGAETRKASISPGMGGERI